MKKQTYFYRPILAAIAATVAGMNLSARAAMLPITDSAAPAPAAVFSPVSLTPAAGRSASLTMTESGPSPYPAYVGTSDPDGTTNASTITVPNTGTGFAPGLLNGVFYTYGVNYTKGALTINAFNGGDSEIIAVGLLGVFHGSLMSPILGNTATDILGDLEASLSLPAGVAGTLEPFIGVTAGTLQHDNPSAYTLLNDANNEYSPFPFSLVVLLSGVNTACPQTFGLDLSNETPYEAQVLGVNDIAVIPIPEPAALSMLLLGGLPVLARRRRRRSGVWGQHDIHDNMPDIAEGMIRNAASLRQEVRNPDGKRESLEPRINADERRLKSHRSRGHLFIRVHRRSSAAKQIGIDCFSARPSPLRG